MAENSERQTEGGAAATSRIKDADKARREFARAIARAELGRFYFGEAAEKALQEARKKHRRKPIP